MAVNADVRELDAVWIEEHDPHLNPIGAKGIGEIGIVGTAAAIGNAFFHATGRACASCRCVPTASSPRSGTV